MDAVIYSRTLPVKKEHAGKQAPCGAIVTKEANGYACWTVDMDEDDVPADIRLVKFVTSKTLFARETAIDWASDHIRGLRQREWIDANAIR